MANVDLNKSGRTKDGDGVLATIMKQAKHSYKFNKRPVVGNGGGGGGGSGVNVAAKVPNRDDCDQPGSTRNSTPQNAVDMSTVYTRMQETIDRQNRVIENDLKAKQLHIDSQQKSIEKLSSALNAVKDELERKDKRMDQMTKMFIDQIQKSEQRIKALKGARVTEGHKAISSTYIMDLENKMEKYVKQLITDGFNNEKDVVAQEYLKIQNALQAEKLRIIEDERKMDAVLKSTDPAMTQPSPCNCQNELHALKTEFERFKSELTPHANMGFVANDDANGQNERNYMFLRKYDKLKARLAAIEREVTRKNSSTSCDPDLVSTIVRTITTAMNSSAVTRCCGCDSGRPRGVEPERTTSGQTAPPTNNDSGGMKDTRVGSPSNVVSGGGPASEPQTPVQGIPPPPPPPPPMAPKTSGAKDVDGSNRTYERYAISNELLNSVTLAKKGEPVKKIKLPPGVVIVRRKTDASTSSDVAAASTSKSASPTESRPITPPPAPPLPAESGSFCPPPVHLLVQGIPPPPPPPPPMAPKTSGAKDVDGSNRTYERYAISNELLNSVTLAKKGEPVKKIKLPPGVVIVRRKTDASNSDDVAAAFTSKSASPTESRPITPPPAPPLPAESGSFCPPPAPPLPTAECGKSNMTSVPHSLRKV